MIARISHGWQYLAVFLVLFHFFVPWFLLLSRDLKRTPHRLVDHRVLDPVRALRRHLHAGVAGVRRRRRRTCTCWHGEHASHFFVHWLDLAAPLAIGGLWLWMFFDAAAAAAAAGRSAIRTCANRSKPREGPLMAHDPARRSRLGRRRVLCNARGLGLRAHRRQRVDDRASSLFWLAASAVVVARLVWLHVRAVRRRRRGRGRQRGVSRSRRAGDRACRRRRGCSSTRRTRSTTSASEETRSSTATAG